MTNNWLNIYNEFNIELTKHEILLVGEKNGKQFSEVFTIPDNAKLIDITNFTKSLNSALDKYNAFGVDTAPKE